MIHQTTPEQSALPFAPTIQQRFEAFHAQHPEVYDKLVDLARMVRRRGLSHYSVYALYNRVRWHFTIERDMGEDFKLNNNYQPYYARLIMAEHPDLAGLFELRELRAQ